MRANTTVAPLRVNTALRGTCSTPACAAPVMVSRPVKPGRGSDAPSTSASVASNVRDGALPPPKKPGARMLPTDVTLAFSVPAGERVERQRRGLPDCEPRALAFSC